MVDVTRTVPQVRSPINHSHTIQWLAILCAPTYRCAHGVLVVQDPHPADQNRQACLFSRRSIVRLPPGNMELDHAENNIQGKYLV